MWESTWTDGLAYFHELIKVGIGAFAINNTRQDALKPCATFATWCALTA
jgi:hypothetical protein